MLLLSALVFIGLLSLGIGLALSYAKRRLAVPKDRFQLQIEAQLPGINCGACGYPSCAQYAEALVRKKTADLGLCRPAGTEQLQSIGKLLKLPAPEPERQVAFVYCKGSPGLAAEKFQYEGLQDCQAASLLFRGSKHCQYSCIGLGSCVRQCPTGAIRIENSLAVVDPGNCIGCELCLPVCPTQVIRMIPQTQRYIVACNSLDHGKTTRNHCKVGCIGCKICEVRHPGLGFQIRKNLASVSPDFAGNPPDEKVQRAIRACPSQCITELPAPVPAGKPESG